MFRYLICFLAIFLSNGKPAYSEDIFPDMALTVTRRVPVKTMLELRFRHMLKQKYDFSCGSAALASLLTYHYNEPIDEMSVLKSMYEVGDQEKINKVGFSMLDMQKYLHSIGLNAQGYRAPLDILIKEQVPAIVLINRNGYTHFVIIKGVTMQRVLLGDPATGTHVMNRSEFEKTWNGVLFVINDEMEIARKSFNLASDWQQREAPASNAVFQKNLNDLTLDIMQTPNYY
jgi:predicted double-glycine peptidase